MKRLCGIFLIALTAVVLLTGDLFAGTYVSFSGKFSITYPDNWYQIDYRTLNFYSTRGGTVKPAVEPEAGFAMKSSNPWNNGPFIILSVDTFWVFTPKDRDSIVQSIAESIETPVNKNPSGATYDASWSPKEVLYWPSPKIASFSIEPKDTVRVRMQLVLKFTDRSIANIYFYCPEKTWMENQQIFSGFLSSFTTDNIQSEIKKEPHKIADAEKLKEESGKSSSFVIIISIFVVALAVVVSIISRKRNKSKND
jgi:hypothetical protein